MGGKIERANAYLLKKPYRDGWRWHGQIRYKDGNGKWRTAQRSLTDAEGSPIMTDADTTDAKGNRVQTTRNIRKARKALELWREEVQGTPTGGRMTVPDYIRADVLGREGAIQGSTLRKYREYAELIGRSPLADVLMRDLDTAKVRAWLRWMKGEGGKDGSGLAPATIKTAYSLLSSTCTRAVENGDMAGNPCTRSLFRVESPKPQTRAEVDATKPNALDAEGVRRANALLDATTNGRLRIGARLALACGLRAGECCGLAWRDVDLDAGTIEVRAAIGRADGGTYDKTPKTPDSYRSIPIPPSLAAELESWRVIQRTRWEALAEGQAGKVAAFGDTYIVGFADGRFMTPHALGNAWTRLAAKGDAQGPLTGTRGRLCTFHDLRHTYATHAIASRADVRTVAALMGHKDASTTLRIYADALPERGRAVMAELADVLTAGSAWATC